MEIVCQKRAWVDTTFGSKDFGSNENLVQSILGQQSFSKKKFGKKTKKLGPKR